MHILRGALATALLAACVSSAQAVVTPISSLHNTTATGIPLLASPPQLVTVQGTVTSPDGIYSLLNSDFYIQDGTGSINVFVGTVLFGVALGDSVQVTGYLKNFNGLAEIDSTAAFVGLTNLGPATFVPNPLLLTCAQAAATFVPGSPASEPNESKLIRIYGVHLSAGAWPTSVSTTNVTLTITDATGSLTLFIDKDTSVNGSPDPGATFDLIGILKQFKSASPWTSGYEIVPRYASDVIPGCSGPGFATLPSADLVSDAGATVNWTTGSNASSVLYYGTTTTYGDSLTDGLFGTSHAVTITGLQPRTLYHMRARASDGVVSCFSPDKVFITYPATGMPGGIQVTFNRDVYAGAMRPGMPAAQANVDQQTQLVNLINSATTSIDCALYSFSLQNVTNALINAHNNRFIPVRLIQDAGNSTAQANQLQGNGIPYITSTYGGVNHGVAAGGGIMHSKYVIIDAAAANKDLARVWTGSWNCSSSGTSDAQNVIVLQDWGLAQAYTMDFNQMWGSSTLTPNATSSRMGSRKAEVIPHQFQVGGIPIQAFMSPSDQTESRLIANIQQSQHADLFCILDFTSDPLSHAMKVHRDSIPGYAVRGLFEPTQVSAPSEWCKFDGQPGCTDYWIPRADVFQDGSTAFNLLHHKYMILDEGYANATVMTGSHNYSNAANTTNDENTLIVHDPVISNLYAQEFWARYLESGGQALDVAPGRASNGSIQLAQSQPNPSAGTTRIRYTLPADAARATLAVYDLSGRRVRTLLDGALAAGAHEARWDGMNDGGGPARAGVYFYRLTVGRETAVRKLALMR